MKPPLLLLHGALGSKAQLARLETALADPYTVHALNFEGHGGRESREAFSMGLFTQNVIDFLAEQHVSRAHIFGYSMGGYVALNLALHHPELVGSIVTFGTKFNWTPEAARKEVKMLNPEVIEAKVPRFAAHLQSMHHPSNCREVLSKTASMMMDLGKQPPLTPVALSNIDQQVLIGIGDLDNMVSIDESRAAAAALPNGQLNILEGFKHPIEKNNLEALAELIHDFMGRDQPAHSHE